MLEGISSGAVTETTGADTSGIIVSDKAGALISTFHGINFSARSTALADSFVANPGDVASSFFLNPAGLAKMGFFQVSTFYNMYWGGLTQTFAGANIPLGSKISVAGCYNVLSTPADKMLDSAGNETGQTFSYMAKYWAAGLGLRLTDIIALGVALKTSTESIYEYEDSRRYLDIGLILPGKWILGCLLCGFDIESFKWDIEDAFSAKGSERFTGGISITNALQMGGLTEKEAWSVYRIGLNYAGSVASLASDVEVNSYGAYWNNGLEFRIGKLTPRLGYKMGGSGASQDTGFRCGLELNLSRFSLEYALSGLTDVTLVHRVSLNYNGAGVSGYDTEKARSEKEKKKREKEEEEQRKKREDQRLKNEKERGEKKRRYTEEINSLVSDLKKANLKARFAVWLPVKDVQKLAADDIAQREQVNLSVWKAFEKTRAYKKSLPVEEIEMAARNIDWRQENHSWLENYLMLARKENVDEFAAIQVDSSFIRIYIIDAKNGAELAFYERTYEIKDLDWVLEVELEYAVVKALELRVRGR